MRTEALRVTQKEIARMLGCSEAVVRKWEGRGDTITLVREFAEAMDTMYKWLSSDQRDRLHAALGAGSVAPLDRSVIAVEARLPDLRRALDAHDMPADGPVRALDLLRSSVASAIDDRLNSNYLRLACELPSLLSELHRAKLSNRYELVDVNDLLLQAYRAADAIADKYGYFDLSARIIAMMCKTEAETGDDVMTAATAYVRTETFFANGQLSTGRKLLERASDTLDPGRSVEHAAAYGALHMRAAVVAAREFRPDDARAHLIEAEDSAGRVAESVYAGTAFGPSSVRIHKVSIGVELGNVADALEASRDWCPPDTVPAERRSHFYIDVARAYSQTRAKDDALAAIRKAQLIAPQHTGNHPHVKEILALLGN